MFVAIENASPQMGKNGREYFSFWAKLFFDTNTYISVSGFKYFPDTRQISTPSFNKGESKGFINTTKLSAEMYNRVRDAAEAAIQTQLTQSA